MSMGMISIFYLLVVAMATIGLYLTSIVIVRRDLRARFFQRFDECDQAFLGVACAALLLVYLTHAVGDSLAVMAQSETGVRFFYGTLLLLGGVLSGVRHVRAARVMNRSPIIDSRRGRTEIT